MVLADLSSQLDKKEITSEDLIQQTLKSVDEKNSKVGAFIEVDKEYLFQMAKASDERRAKDRPLSQYDGIPIGMKDNILVLNQKSECSSKILKDFISPYDATVTDKLKKYGFIPMGRLNMDEFAMGSSTENSALLKAKNPYDLERAPGGSSGGSAAAVSANMVSVSLGSDTGGSIRQPAAFCGVVGLKPTYGTVSRYGLVAFGSSFDQIGPLANSVDDVETIWSKTVGFDQKDSTSVQHEGSTSKDKMVIGYSKSFLDQCDDVVRESIEASMKIIEKKHILKAIELPNHKYAGQVYYIVTNSEASANLARFDGIRYGRREEGDSLIETYENSRSAGFGPEVKRRILLGTFALSSGYYDAFYGRAQKARNLIKHDYENAFNDVDAILIPTTPTAPFKLGERIEDPLAMYAADLFTVGASLAGIPAMSLPSPFEGLPIGVQLQAPYFEEERLFQLGRDIEVEFKAPGPSL